jgi:putative N6-adenine-specific DNA methylase
VVVRPGHVALTVADLSAVATLCHLARTPARLLLPVAQGPVRTLDELARLVRGADWSPYLHRKDRVDVQVSTGKTRIRRKDAVEKKVKHAISDAMRARRGRPLRRPPVEQLVRVRLDEHQAVVSLDVGGGLLHKRGWRTDSGRAPLRETLAASLLVLSGWTREEALLDPFCGAGTFPIEAALMGARRSPFVGKTLPCTRWPALCDWRMPRTAKGTPALAIHGSDHASRAIERSRENARRAGVSLSFEQVDIAHIEAKSEPGLVICNPPYGARLGKDDQTVRSVYKALGRSLRGELAGWRALFLAPNARLAGLVDRDAFQITTFSNGGMRVGVWGMDGT